MNYYYLLLLFPFLISCHSTPEKTIHLGQGIMAGEASTTSIILQARLTKKRTLVLGDLDGMQGVGTFEISEDKGMGRILQEITLGAHAENDFIVKTKVIGLAPNTHYYYRLIYGAENSKRQDTSKIASFRTLGGRAMQTETSIAIVTGMNYYHFHYGKYDSTKAYKGADKTLGYPALEAIRKRKPDYFVGTGDNVYFDHPNSTGFARAVDKGTAPHPGGYEGKEVVDEKGMRRKYHEQFSQARFIDLFQEVATYWEKDDHDYRFNDADPQAEFPISHELGIKNFREQVPIVDPKNPAAKTYRTHRINKDLQIWLVEGRDYRSSNKREDGPEKTLWGKEQLTWLQETLLESDATFKVLISPTALVGPDDAYKKDNHVNHQGFRYEGDAFFSWLGENDFLQKNFYIICGDRHWQYHAQHPSGFEEFSCGALVDNNARAGRLAGDPKSTDPDALIKQLYIQGTKESATGGFLEMSLKLEEASPKLIFRFFDEKGASLYTVEKTRIIGKLMLTETTV